LGSIPEVLKVGIAQLNVDLAARYGPVFKVGYGHYLVVAVADAHLARYPPPPDSCACSNGMAERVAFLVKSQTNCKPSPMHVYWYPPPPNPITPPSLQK